MGTNHAAKNRAIEETLRQKELFPSTSAPWQQKVLEVLLSQVSFSKDSICLDAACGIGNNFETLLRHFHKIIAFDKSAKAIEFAKELHGENKTRAFCSVGNIESIPYPDNFFDCIVCTEALEHVPDYDTVVKEIFRVTKSGGYAILSFQNHFNLSVLSKFLFEKIYKKNWDVWGTHRHEEGYENYLTCFKVKRSIEKSGFISVKEIGADYINAWFSWIPFLYRNYRILDRYPLLPLGRMPLLKYFGMDYFMLLKKTMNNLRVASFGNRNKKEVSLTFDDGPNPYFTQKILDTLDSFDIKATFFVIGKRCLQYPEILKEIKQRGHLIGNHTFSHKKGDFEVCGSEITHIIGEASSYVRPPFYDLSFCREEHEYLENKFIITGDVDSKDYLSISQDEVFKNVLANVNNGSIIDFHDGSETDDGLKTRAQKTVNALPLIITALRKQFNLVRIDGMDLQFSDFKSVPTK